jgi:hypothetical protein
VAGQLGAFGKKEELEAALAEFRSRAAQVQATVKEATIERVIDAIGIRWDLTHKTVGTLPPFSAKLAVVLRRLSPKLSLRGLLSVVMATMWHVRVHHAPPGRHLAEALKVLARAMGGGVTMDELLLLPAQLVAELRAYGQVVEAGLPWKVPHRPSPVRFWYADASPFGWGVVMGDHPINDAVVPPQASVYQGQWTPRQANEPQFRREAMALGEMKRLMEAHPRWMQARHHRIYMDPEGLVAAVAKGFSLSEGVNHQIINFREFISGHSWEFKHVAGLLNPADGPSRKFPFH